MTFLKEAEATRTFWSGSRCYHFLFSCCLPAAPSASLSWPGTHDKIDPTHEGCTASASAPPSRGLEAWGPRRRPDLRFWGKHSVSAMLLEAWPRSGRRTGSTSGLCPEGKTRRRCDFPVAQARACRIRAERCAAWSPGWVLTERTRGRKLWRRPQSAVRSLEEAEEG